MTLIRGLGAVTASLGLTALAQAQDNTSALEEITVTATRQVDTVNRVPLSIQAITQDNLDRQGIKNSADLVRAVPGLATVNNPGGDAADLLDSRHRRRSGRRHDQRLSRRYESHEARQHRRESEQRRHCTAAL